MQSMQVNDALQAVEPNALIILVFVLLHKGHGIVFPSPVRNALSLLWPIGGAMPFASIFSRVSSEIQSVVQAGLMDILIWALGSTTRAALRLSSEMTSVAGHPE